MSTWASGAQGKRPRKFAIKTVDRAFTYCLFPSLLLTKPNFPLFTFSVCVLATKCYLNPHQNVKYYS